MRLSLETLLLLKCQNDVKADMAFDEYCELLSLHDCLVVTYWSDGCFEVGLSGD